MAYYAAVNGYSTQTSVGFCNTWSAIKFDSRDHRDLFVRESDALATRAVTVQEAKNLDAWPAGQYVTADGNVFQWCSDLKDWMQDNKELCTLDGPWLGQIVECLADWSDDWIDDAMGA
jgi:hypothetical protein